MLIFKNYLAFISLNFVINSLGVSRYAIMSTAEKDIYFFFSYFYLLNYILWLIAFVSIIRIMTDSCGKSRIPVLILTCSRNTSFFFFRLILLGFESLDGWGLLWNFFPREDGSVSSLTESSRGGVVQCTVVTVPIPMPRFSLILNKSTHIHPSL